MPAFASPVVAPKVKVDPAAAALPRDPAADDKVQKKEAALQTMKDEVTKLLNDKIWGKTSLNQTDIDAAIKAIHATPDLNEFESFVREELARQYIDRLNRTLVEETIKSGRKPNADLAAFVASETTRLDVILGGGERGKKAVTLIDQHGAFRQSDAVENFLNCTQIENSEASIYKIKGEAAYLSKHGVKDALDLIPLKERGDASYELISRFIANPDADPRELDKRKDLARSLAKPVTPAQHALVNAAIAHGERRLEVKNALDAAAAAAKAAAATAATPPAAAPATAPTTPGASTTPPAAASGAGAASSASAPAAAPSAPATASTLTAPAIPLTPLQQACADIATTTLLIPKPDIRGMVDGIKDAIARGIGSEEEIRTELAEQYIKGMTEEGIKGAVTQGHLYDYNETAESELRNILAGALPRIYVNQSKGETRANNVDLGAIRKRSPEIETFIAATGLDSASTDELLGANGRPSKDCTTEWRAIPSADTKEALLELVTRYVANDKGFTTDPAERERRAIKYVDEFLNGPGQLHGITKAERDTAIEHGKARLALRIAMGVSTPAAPAAVPPVTAPPTPAAAASTGTPVASPAAAPAAAVTPPAPAADPAAELMTKFSLTKAEAEYAIRAGTVLASTRADMLARRESRESKSDSIILMAPAGVDINNPDLRKAAISAATDQFLRADRARLFDMSAATLVTNFKLLATEFLDPSAKTVSADVDNMMKERAEARQNQILTENDADPIHPDVTEAKIAEVKVLATLFKTNDPAALIAAEQTELSAGAEVKVTAGIAISMGQKIASPEELLKAINDLNSLRKVVAEHKINNPAVTSGLVDLSAKLRDATKEQINAVPASSLSTTDKAAKLVQIRDAAVGAGIINTADCSNLVASALVDRAKTVKVADKAGTIAAYQDATEISKALGLSADQSGKILTVLKENKSVISILTDIYKAHLAILDPVLIDTALSSKDRLAKATKIISEFKVDGLPDSVVAEMRAEFTKRMMNTVVQSQKDALKSIFMDSGLSAENMKGSIKDRKREMVKAGLTDAQAKEVIAGELKLYLESDRVDLATLKGADKALKVVRMCADNDFISAEKEREFAGAVVDKVKGKSATLFNEASANSGISGLLAKANPKNLSEAAKVLARDMISASSNFDEALAKLNQAEWGIFEVEYLLTSPTVGSIPADQLGITERSKAAGDLASKLGVTVDQYGSRLKSIGDTLFDYSKVDKDNLDGLKAKRDEASVFSEKLGVDTKAFQEKADKRIKELEAAAPRTSSAPTSAPSVPAVAAAAPGTTAERVRALLDKKGTLDEKLDLARRMINTAGIGDPVAKKAIFKDELSEMRDISDALGDTAAVTKINQAMTELGLV